MKPPYTFATDDPRQIADWNQFVSGHAHGWLSHQTEWCSALAQAFPFLSPRYAIVRNSAGQIAAALPLFLQKTYTGQRRLISLPHTTLCDPLATDPEALGYLIGLLPHLMNQEKASALEIRAFQTSDLIESLDLGKTSDYIHHEIALDKSEDELLASFDRTSVRNRIRKTLKGPLKVRVGETIHDLQTFHALYTRSRQRLGLPVQPWAFLRSLWQNLYPTGIELLIVELEGKVIGGLIVLLNHSRASAEIITYDEENKALCPNHLVFWTAICRARIAGRKKFDFGRTPLSEQNLISVKDRWGTQTRPLSHFSMPAAPAKNQSQTRPLYEFSRNVLRNSPQPLYTALSRIFYRWHC